MFAFLVLVIAVFSDVYSNADPSDPDTCYDFAKDCQRCFDSTLPSCKEQSVHHSSARTFTPVLEMGNWASSELVSSVFRILAEEVLGFGVRTIVREDYLEVYQRTGRGNVTIALETWDQQMNEDKILYYTEETRTVESSKLGTTGVEGIFIPGYVDETILTFGNSYYSFQDVDELESLVGPFIRAGSTQCTNFDVTIKKGHEEFCKVEDFDCEKLTYHGKKLDHAYDGPCMAKDCNGSPQGCDLNGYWALTHTIDECYQECNENTNCIGFSYRKKAVGNQGLCQIHSSYIVQDENHEGWQLSIHGFFEIARLDLLPQGAPKPLQFDGSIVSNRTTCWVKIEETRCSPASFDLPCPRFTPGWSGGTNCTHPEKSMWCPSQCMEDPSECMEVMMITPAWAPGWFESLSKTLKVPFCFVYYGLTSFRRVFKERYERRENFFFWGYTPTKILLEYDHIMVDFPGFNEHCGALDRQDPTLSRIYCSFEDQILGKIIQKEIAQSVASIELYPKTDQEMNYHDLFELWDNFVINDNDYEWLLSRYEPDGDSRSSNGSTSAVACEYVKQHNDKWCDWVQNTSAFNFAPSKWKLSRTLFWFLSIFLGMTSIKTVFMTIFMIKNRKDPVIKSASYILSMIIIFGVCLVLCGALINILADEMIFWCILNQWFFHIGNGLIYSTLFCKVYRIHIIFEGSLQRKTFKISNYSIARYIGIYQLLLNGYFLIFVFTHNEHVFTAWDGQQFTDVCWLDAPPMILILHLVGIVGFMFTLVAAFRARNSPGHFNESPVIFKLVCFLIVPRVILTAFYCKDLEQTFSMRKVCQCLNEILSAAAVVWFLFSHRIKMLYFSPTQMSHVSSAFSPQFRGNSFMSRIVYHDGEPNSDSSQITNSAYASTTTNFSRSSMPSRRFTDQTGTIGRFSITQISPTDRGMRSITLSASGNVMPCTINASSSCDPSVAETSRVTQFCIEETRNNLNPQSIITDSSNIISTTGSTNVSIVSINDNDDLQPNCINETYGISNSTSRGEETPRPKPPFMYIPSPKSSRSSNAFAPRPSKRDPNQDVDNPDSVVFADKSLAPYREEIEIPKFRATSQSISGGSTSTKYHDFPDVLKNSTMKQTTSNPTWKDSIFSPQTSRASSNMQNMTSHSGKSSIDSSTAPRLTKNSHGSVSVNSVRSVDSQTRQRIVSQHVPSKSPASPAFLYCDFELASPTNLSRLVTFE